MITTLIAGAFTIAYVYSFWCLYVLVMGLYRAHLNKKLMGFSLWMAYPIVLFAYVVDLVANFTFATIWFLEFPHKHNELVTDRLIRYLNEHKDWRNKHAEWVCHTLLDNFDPSGKHCKTYSK